jgi:hypothetical protein
MLFLPLLLLVPWATAALKPVGRPLREWVLPPSLGRVSCMDPTSSGLVGGTSQGYVAKFPLEVAACPEPAVVTRLSDGQSLMHVHAKGALRGACFYDERHGRYVARTADASGAYKPSQALHKTHIVGGGFMRLRLDVCYFTLAIDGRYTAWSVRRGMALKEGNIRDVVGAEVGTPTCVSVVEDGVVAIGLHNGQIVLLDIEAGLVSAWLRDGLFAPRAIHAIPAHGAANAYDYVLVWTSNAGDVMRGVANRRIFEPWPLPILVEDVERVGTDALVQVRTSQQGVVTVQADAGHTYYKSQDGPFEKVKGGWIVPVPRMENFAWRSNEQQPGVALVFVADSD